MLRASVASVVSIIALCTGCATIVTGGGPTQVVRYSSEPSGARVYADENYVGLTPTSSSLTRSDDHTIRMELYGQEQTTKLHSGFNACVLGNILVGGLIGTAVDACSGAATGLNTTSVHDKFELPAYATYVPMYSPGRP